MLANIGSVFTSIKWLDGEQRKVIVDICGEIINRNPTKEELKDLKRKPSKRELLKNKEYLLEFLKYFDKKEGRIPEERDFCNNPKYPSFATYQRAFGSWNNAIDKAGLVKTKYKISISKDGETFFNIIVDDGKLITSPTEEDLEGAIIKSYSKTNICHRCREANNITDKSILHPGNIRREKNKDRKNTGEWICKSHYNKDYEHWSINNDPNSLPAIRKSLANRRTGNLNATHLILSDNCQETTCIWLGVKDLNKELNIYNTPIDHTPITKDLSIMIGGKLVDLFGKIPQTKCRTLAQYGGWDIKVYEEHNKKFDVLILYCVSIDGKNVERIYIFPKEEIVGRNSITIVKNPSKGRLWYERFRVADEETIKINEIWYNIIKNKNK